jgi:flagellar biosynthesis/type III secretory pathway chaperone
MNSQSQDDARQQIVEVIGECVYQALGLKESLRDEHLALERQDAEALDLALTTKSQCVSRLQALDEKRSSLCAASGFDAGPEQMERMSEWCDQDSEIGNCWQQLMEIASDCNSLNLTNGAIIRLRRQHIDTSLAVLRGVDQANDTYVSSGGNRGAMNQRSLARA